MIDGHEGHKGGRGMLILAWLERLTEYELLIEDEVYCTLHFDVCTG